MNNYPYDGGSAAAGLAGLAVFGVLIIPFFIFLLIGIISFWRIFTKAGKPGWAALIPIYNLVVWMEIIGKPVWWVLLFFIPCVNFIFIIWSVNLLSKSFGQSEGFTIGLLLLGIIFYPILAFGNYQYLGPAGAGIVNPIDPSIGYQDPFSPNSPQV